MVEFEKKDGSISNSVVPFWRCSLMKFGAFKAKIVINFLLVTYNELEWIQVSGCLSYNDKISDGFYNILGINPYLWVMCNDVDEGKRLPPLMSLKAIDPCETSMEVVLVDRHGDSRLKELEDKAQELYCDSENMLVLVEKLGKLVAIYMGYARCLFIFGILFKR